MSTDLTMENFGSMIDNIIAGICFFEYESDTKKLTPFFMNEGLFRMLGYSRVEGIRYLKDIRRSVIPDDLPILEQGIEDALKDDGSVEIEFRTVTGSGSLRWLQVRGNLYAREGKKYILVTVIQDITEKKSIEEELHMQAERLHILSEAEGEKIIDYNAKTDVMTIRSSHDYGQKGEAILGDYLQQFRDDEIFEEDREYYHDAFLGLLKSPKHDTIEFRTKRFESDYTWYQANLTSLLGSEGYVTRIVGRLINIHEKKLKEIDLLLRAEKDALTGLYNKGATLQLIENAIEEEKINNTINALMIIDLDNFKEVNDTLGHAQGDKVLIDTANALSEIFKGGDVVGRIGGDEFVVFMRNINSISNADILASKIVNKVDFHLPTEEKEIHVTCSIGIAIFPYHGSNYEELFNKADKAVYTAKANGKNGYRIYDAATTMAYHATRKNTGYNAEKGMEITRNIEDMVMQILYDDKVMESALKSAIELMTVHYKFHRGYICDKEQEGLPIQFSTSGYELGKESKEHYELRKVVSETLFESFKNFSVIHDYDVSAEELRYYFNSEGIKSMLYYPLTSKGEFKGAIILENHEVVQLELEEGKIEEIRSLLRILEAHILQIGLMDRLQDFVTHIGLFDNMDNFVYIINTDTYELSFINKKVLMSTPNIRIGDTCYKALQHRDAPCENCIFKHLDKKDPHARHSEELFNYSLRSWTRCSASWLECKEENALGVVQCIDISEYFIG
ncbi:MAG: diguanylate cyclase [Lachnospiraceae bacterium]|nr:diguanylate cyclase [Lachnospiraceae bacterium]